MDSQDKHKLAKSYFQQPDSTRSKFDALNLNDPSQPSKYKRPNAGQKEMQLKKQFFLSP